ncbi:MAG: acyl-CoA thioesterase [Balneolaceae bacterium]
MTLLPNRAPLYTYTHSIRCRYGETDKMGYVYYGHYLTYFEEARTEMIRTFGYPYSRLEKEGMMLPVIYSQISYKKPVYYDEVMQIRVHLFDEPAIRLQTYYEVCTRNGQDLNATGQVTLCFMDEQSRRPCRVPDAFLATVRQTIDDHAT